MFAMQIDSYREIEKNRSREGGEGRGDGGKEVGYGGREREMERGR